MNENFIQDTVKKKINITIIAKKNTSHVKFSIYWMRESDAENHFLMLLLKMCRDFVVRSPSGGSFQ